MTDPITPIAGATGNDSRRLPPVEPAPPPAKAPPGTHLEVAKADEAPVYVCRVLDGDTGRTLVEIPRQGADFKDERPGVKIDTNA